jgi:Serine/threonine protein kinase involved in cell cycle control
MTDEYGLLDTDAVEGVGDEWEDIDVTDTEADQIARDRDREFEQFEERIKDAEHFKVEQSVFDDATFGALYKLVEDDHIEAFGGPISTGKEANVYEAMGGDSEVASRSSGSTPRPSSRCASIWRATPGFEGIGNDKKQIVLAWVRKEFANLQRAQEAGVRVPTPIAVERNVLVMELVGLVEDRARRLAEVSVENPETAYEVVREYMRRLHTAGLIHGDLSEYNMIIHDGELVIIDLGQAMTVHHPNARDLLERDCENVASFFSRQGLDVSSDDLFAFVAGDDARLER